MQEKISDDLNNIRGSSFFSIANKEAEPWNIDNQVQEKILKWLSPPNPSTNHNKARGVHEKVPPRWFLEGSIYREWKEKGSLLWVHGKRMVFILSRSGSL
jgi:hypothetical protein